MTEGAHEAQECLKLVLRGEESVESARALIAVSQQQEALLKKALGAQAQLIIERRRLVLAQFERLLREVR